MEFTVELSKTSTNLLDEMISIVECIIEIHLLNKVTC